MKNNKRHPATAMRAQQGRHAGLWRLPTLALAALALSACSPRPPTAQFQADLCGRMVNWEYKAKYWDALYTGQLPGYRELTLALSVPRIPPQPDQPTRELSVQFNLEGEPGLLQADGAPKLVGRFPLRADDLNQRADAAVDAAARRQARLAAAIAPPGPDARTGMATVFGDKGVLWNGGAGELLITEVRVIERDEPGGSSGMAVASGSFRFDATPTGSGMACVISGSFKDASFRLRN